MNRLNQARRKARTTKAAAAEWWDTHPRLSCAYDVLRGRPTMYGVELSLPTPNLIVRSQDNVHIRNVGISGAGLRFENADDFVVSGSRVDTTATADNNGVRTVGNCSGKVMRNRFGLAR